MSAKFEITHKKHMHGPHYQRLIAHAHAFLFRISKGRIGGHFDRAPILLLTTRGRTTSRLRTIPLHYLLENNQIIVIARGRHPQIQPGWWRNLQQDASGIVEIGKKIVLVKAREASDEERLLLWTIFRHRYPEYTSSLPHLKQDTPFIYLTPFKIMERQSTQGEHEE